MNKSWTEAECLYLREHWGRISSREIGQRLGRSMLSVVQKAHGLKLARLTSAITSRMPGRQLSNPPSLNDLSDIWNYIDKSDGPDACWPWLRGKSASGYGAVTFDLGGGRKQYGPHRIIVYLRDGVLTNRHLVVRHTCDNRGCCNPAHLVLGTPQENARDMVERKRNHKNHARGVDLPFAKLTDDRVRTARREYIAGATVRGLAEKYGVSDGAMMQVLRYQTWKHVDA